MRALSFFSLVTSVATCVLSLSQSAHAQDLASCGNVYLADQAQCTVIPPTAQCDVMCTPISLEASCAADLHVACEGKCNVDIDAACNLDCSASCMASCNVDPGSFDCTAQCQGECAGDCDAQCGKPGAAAHCSASCKASCTGSCNASCKVVPPSASCQGRCDASCKGSCHAKANVDCNVKCQASGYVDCEARLMGGCEAACKTQKGALFCEGQFVDTSNLDECVAALKKALDVNVQGYAEGESSCDAGTCQAHGSAGASCAVTAVGSGHSRGALALVGIFGLGVFARRRRAKR
jgi:MYXO-CTERM domain-containing protein